MNVQPILDRVLILQSPAEKQVGNFSVVTAKDKKPAQGKVVAIGIEVQQCKVNDIVDFDENTVTEHEIEGLKYVLIRENNIQLIR